MSIFAKKQEWEPKATPDIGPPAASGAAGRKDYGIAEAIQLLRGLPVDQNVELVVRVVRATLASLNVRLADIIEDANRKQKATQDRRRARQGRRARETARRSPARDLVAGGRPERDDHRQGTAADGREGREQHAPLPDPREQRGQRAAHPDADG
jgi:hypothetical protein